MDLARTQFLSLATKAVTTLLGIAQSVLVVRILSPAEFGLVGLVTSIGGVIGVSQHLGIVDGAIREIAVLKDRREIAKVFWVSHIVRQLVTIPLSVGLLLLAGVIASNIYGRPEITLFLQIFAAALVLQGLQDVLGATLTGMKKFVTLYAVQIVTAAINVAAFGYLTWRFGVAGFFWAIIGTTSIMVLLLFGLIVRYLRDRLRLPSLTDIRQYAWRVMRIGAYMYLARIFFIVWQRLPILMLGSVLAAEELGFLNVSLTFGSKLTIIAMALSEVNLSWMSSLYSDKRDQFNRVVTHNMHRVLVLMMMLTLVLLFFTPEILRYVIGVEYLPAQPLILVMTLGFFLYALTDIGTSSVFVPADQPKLRAYTYALMTGISAAVIAVLLLTQPSPLLAAYAVLGGAVASYAAMIVVARRRFGVTFVTWQLGWLLVALGASVVWLLMEPGLMWRLIVFVLFAFYLVWEAQLQKLLPKFSLLRTKEGGQGGRTAGASDADVSITCFAGAEYGLSAWTNRQHVMSRVAKRYPVLYVEPRVWIFRYVARHWHNPTRVAKYLWRLVGYERAEENLFVVSQWNLIPGSREMAAIAQFNHLLNRYRVLLLARWLGFRGGRQVVWLYDTEGAEYLSAFRAAAVVYDCVDDHAAQAGVDRNPARVKEEEGRILARADLVTVTSHKLYELKRRSTKNVHLVEQAGDVELYRARPHTVPRRLAGLPRPIIGLVGALDTYKIDFEALRETAEEHPDWHFVLIGAPVVTAQQKGEEDLREVMDALENVHFFGAVDRRKVPGFVYGFDVCLIPYQANRYNSASFPLKFWEFMATGKPVVAMGVPELSKYRPFIEYAESTADLAGALERALQDPGLNTEERKARALEHSFEKRAEAILTLLKRVL